MKMKYLRIPVFCLALIIVFSLFNGVYPLGEKYADDYHFVAKAVTYIGSCGKKCKWTLDIGNGILSIEGTGKTFDYESKSSPWYKYRESIDKIVVGEGINTLGTYFFSGLSAAKTVILPKSLKSIHNGAFVGCSSLKKVNCASGIKLINIGEEAFAYCRKLESIPYSSVLETIGRRAFYYCYNLKSVSLSYSVKEIGAEAFGYCRYLNKIRIVNYNCKIDDGENTFNKSAAIEGFKSSTAKTYADKYSRTFKVIKDINYLNDMTAKLSYTSTVCNGKPKKPKVKIKGLKEGVDFAVSYSDNKNLGVACVYIKAAGDTLGEKKLTFKINPAKVKSVKLSERKKDSLKIKWSAVEKAQKYEVFQLVGKQWQKIKATDKTFLSISGLSGATKYSFKVRAVYGEGKEKCTGKFSPVFTDCTKPSETEITKTGIVRGGGKVRITLKNVSGVDGYELYIATAENGKYKKAETLSSKSKLSFVIGNLDNSNTYYFKARTFVKNGDAVIYGDFCKSAASEVL